MASEQITNQTALVLGTTVMFILVSFIVTFIFLYQRKLIKRKLAYQQIEDLLKKQELETTYALLKGQDAERQRIANELHDNLGSVLVTLSMYADQLIKNNIPEKQKELLFKINSIANHAYSEARKISHELDAHSLKFGGLQTAIQDLASVINGVNNIQVKANIQVDGDVGMDLSFNLYRITQELINNTLKYARASEINIEITKVKDDYLSFIYEDNGIGINSSLSSKGMGMQTIATRVEKMGGSHTVHTKGKNGFTMIIEIPLS